MFKFNIFKRYFFIEYSKTVLNVTLMFLALGIILNIFEEVNFFKDHAVGFLLPVTLTFLKVPSMIYRLFPFIFLISSIILFLRFVRSEEIIALKIAGISNFRIIIFPALISLVFGIIIVTGINTVTSKLTHKYLDIKNQYTKDNDYLAALTENGIWIKDKIDGNTNIIRAKRLSKNDLIDVSIYKFDENNKPQVRIEARKADVSSTGMQLSVASGNYGAPVNLSTYLASHSFVSNFEINSIKNIFSNLDAVSFWELNKLKENYKFLGYSTKEIESEFQRALSFPFFLMSMTLLAGAVVMNVRYKGNYMSYVIITIILSVIIFYLNDLSRALGETEQISLIMSVARLISASLYTLVTLDLGMFFPLSIISFFANVNTCRLLRVSK